MYVICFKSKPQTAEQIACRESGMIYKASYDDSIYHAARTKSTAIADFINYHGFTWPEWKKEGYTIEKCFFQWCGAAVKTARKVS